MPRVINIFVVLIVSILWGGVGHAVTAAGSYMRQNTYDNMYPYMNNNMRTKLDPGTNPSRAPAQISVLTRTDTTNSVNNTRRVVPRSGTQRAAINSAAASLASAAAATSAANSARSATSGNASAGRGVANNTRRVVARAGRSGTATTMARGSTRADASVAGQNTTNAVYIDSTDPLPSSRCMADYIDCMNTYCMRDNTAYKRCYCSAKLSQIDAMYQPTIDSLIKQILALKSTNKWSDAEMNEYWMDRVGNYTGENAWANLDAALDIDWTATESRVRGQQSFAIGHEYCVQHLRGCAYMASNLRDAYRSEIARDCATYESSLQKLKTIAESVVSAFK